MKSAICDVCRKEYSEPNMDKIPEDTPKEELVCGYCWLEIDMSSMPTDEIVSKIRRNSES